MNALEILPASAYSLVLSAYQEQPMQFPLIASVLDKQQHGWVYWDSKHENYFIIHHFGFCQLLELASNAAFDDQFYTHFLQYKNFPVIKLRWYAVSDKWQKLLAEANDNNIAVVERAQFTMPTTQRIDPVTLDINYVVQTVNHENFDEVEAQLKLQLASRFWMSKQQFIQQAMAAVVFNQQQPISICYACAVASQHAEIDVFTDSAYRQQGVANLVLTKFLELCQLNKVLPHWDCYTNNVASYNLAKKFGFVLQHVYAHAIISK